MDPEVNRIWVDYPLNGDIHDLYRPGLSNGGQMLGQSKALFRKLKKAGLTEAFQEQMDKSVREGHMEILSKEEAAAALSGPHCFSGINFQCKASSKTQKLRVVTNSSSFHSSGSLNSHILVVEISLEDLRTSSRLSGWESTLCSSI